MDCGVLKTYAEAEAVRESRTDWTTLPVKACTCGQQFRVEVEGQRLCRDCQALQGFGFYQDWLI